MSGPGIALNLEQFKAAFLFYFGFLHQHGVVLEQLIPIGRDHQPVPQRDVGALLAFLNPLSRNDAEEASRQGRQGRKVKTGGGHFINRNAVHRLAACFPCVSFQFLCVLGGLCVRHSDLN